MVPPELRCCVLHGTALRVSTAIATDTSLELHFQVYEGAITKER